MRVHKAHLVQEATGDTDHHVIDVRNDGTAAGELLAVGEPQVNTDVVLSDLAEVHVDVLEVTGECTTGSLDSDKTRLDVNGDCMDSTKVRAKIRTGEDTGHANMQTEIQRNINAALPPSGMAMVRDARTCFMMNYFIKEWRARARGHKM